MLVSLACHVYRCILLFILLVNPAGGLKATGLTPSRWLPQNFPSQLWWWWVLVYDDMIWYDMIWYDLVGLVFGWMCNRVDKTMMCNCVTWYVWRRWLQQCLVKAALVVQQEPAVLLIVIFIYTSTSISIPVLALAWIWLWMWKWFNGCAWKLQTHSWWNCKIHYMYHSLSCIAQYV